MILKITYQLNTVCTQYDGNDNYWLQTLKHNVQSFFALLLFLLLNFLFNKPQIFWQQKYPLRKKHC